jgi:hypothetical protein
LDLPGKKKKKKLAVFSKQKELNLTLWLDDAKFIKAVIPEEIK